MASKKIIIIFILLFVITSAYLFFVDRQDSSLDFQKNWWVAYFNDPKNGSLSFVIENHSDKSNFHWQADGDRGKIYEGDATIAKGSQKNINVNTAGINDKKITITVSDGTEKKEIYKNF